MTFMHESIPNTIDYVEMPSRNLAETKRFFSALFGWSFQDYGPDYAAFDDGLYDRRLFRIRQNC